MASSQPIARASTTTSVLQKILQSRLTYEQFAWFEQRRLLIGTNLNERDLHISLGMIPRKLGRAELSPTNEELSDAHQAMPGWNPHHWSVDTAARVLLLETVALTIGQPFGVLFKKLCQTADLRESIALYQGIALYPASDELDYQVGEGLRTSVSAVFEAIAHYNPYPYRQFDQLRWNHMVLKALFIESALHPIQGLDARANPELASILCDYAHERWAASRPVTPELWRCVGPFASGNMLSDLSRVLDSGEPLERQAAALALASNPDKTARDCLDSAPLLSSAIVNGQLTWESIATEI